MDTECIVAQGFTGHGRVGLPLHLYCDVGEAAKDGGRTARRAGPSSKASRLTRMPGTHPVYGCQHIDSGDRVQSMATVHLYGDRRPENAGGVRPVPEMTTIDLGCRVAMAA